jgi:hypothetical protein
MVPVDHGRGCLGSTHNSHAEEVELESTSARVGSASRAARWYLIPPQVSPESFTWLEPYSTAQAGPS